MSNCEDCPAFETCPAGVTRNSSACARELLEVHAVQGTRRSMITLEDLARLHWKSRNQGRKWEHELRSVQAEEVEATRAVLKAIMQPDENTRLKNPAYRHLQMIVEGKAGQ